MLEHSALYAVDGKRFEPYYNRYIQDMNKPWNKNQQWS